jgi:hypothetical protein
MRSKGGGVSLTIRVAHQVWAKGAPTRPAWPTPSTRPSACREQLPITDPFREEDRPLPSNDEGAPIA